MNFKDVDRIASALARSGALGETIGAVCAALPITVSPGAFHSRVIEIRDAEFPEVWVEAHAASAAIGRVVRVRLPSEAHAASAPARRIARELGLPLVDRLDLKRLRRCGVAEPLEWE